MNALWQDLRFSIRALLKNRGFTFAAVCTLALGIGATTTIFTVVYSVLFPKYPYSEPDRIVALSVTGTKGRSGFAPSLPGYVEWRERNQVFEELAAYSSNALAWLDQGEPERIRGIKATSNIFRVAGVQPFPGRDFDADADQLGKGNVVILGHGFWQRRYGGQSDVIGKSVTIDNKPYSVIGVMPSDRGYPGANTNYWIPWVLDEDPNRWTSMTGGAFSVVGRLKRGVSLQQAEDAMNLLARDQATSSDASGAPSVIKLRLVMESFNSWGRETVWTLFGVVLFLLLIACVNVANLLLARASARGKEIAVRVALGAPRWQIVRQLLTECLLVSLIGGATGVLLAHWGVRLFLVLKPRGVPGPADAGLNSAVLLFALGASCITAVVFGCLPMLHASRGDVVETLKQIGATSTQVRAHRLRAGLVVAEIALSGVLLAGAGLTIRSFVKLLNVELGFDPTNIVTLRITVPELENQKQGDRGRVLFVDELLARFQAIPQVRAAAASSTFPLDGSTTYSSIGLNERASGTKKWQKSEPVWVSEDYFQAMGIPLLRGRLFAHSKDDTAAHAVIVSQRAAQLFWPGEDSIGKTVWFMSDPAPHEIIAVCGNARYGSVQTEFGPKVYRLLTRGSVPWAVFIVRTTGEPVNLIPALKQEVWAVNPRLPVDSVQTMKDLYEPWIAGPRFYLGLFGSFAFIAVLMAAIGVYGVVQYAVGQRTQEIGIRIALGAQGENILLMVLRTGLVLGVIGVAIGLGGAILLTRFIRSFLFGVTPTDAWTLGVVSALLLIMAILAGWIPARRASKTDPVVSLRHE